MSIQASTMMKDSCGSILLYLKVTLSILFLVTLKDASMIKLILRSSNGLQSQNRLSGQTGIHTYGLLVVWFCGEAERGHWKNYFLPWY